MPYLLGLKETTRNTKIAFPKQGRASSMMTASGRLNKTAHLPTFGVSASQLYPVCDSAVLMDASFIPDKVQAQFPWYKRMHALMGTSPIVDQSAIANSTTDIDLTVLYRSDAGSTEAREAKKSQSMVGRLFFVTKYVIYMRTRIPSKLTVRHHLLGDSESVMNQMTSALCLVPLLLQM